MTFRELVKSLTRYAVLVLFMLGLYATYQGAKISLRYLDALDPSAVAEAQGQSPTELQGEVSGFETLSVTNGAAVAFTAGTAANAKAAFCTVETQSIRYRMDGTAPTTAVGHLQLSSATSNVAYWFSIVGKNKVIAFRMIATTGTASVTCSYLR